MRRPWGFSPEARRGSRGASRAAPGKSGLHARGEGERVLALESLPVTRKVPILGLTYAPQGKGYFAFLLFSFCRTVSFLS